MTKRLSASAKKQHEELLLNKLKESGLDKQDIARYGLLGPEVQPKIKTWFKENTPSLTIPYYTIEQTIKNNSSIHKLKKLAGSEVYKIPPEVFCRVRRLKPPAGFQGKVAKPAKYLQKPKTAPRIYFDPTVKWQTVANDSKVPLIITEGELKVMCYHKHVYLKTQKEFPPALALGGVFSFGSKSLSIKLLPEFDLFDWKDREVYIIFDSDYETNTDIRIAAHRLAYYLTTDKGAVMFINKVPLSRKGERQGLDDYLMSKSTATSKFARIQDLLNSASPYELTRGLLEINELFAVVPDKSLFINLATGAKMNRETFSTRVANKKVFNEEGRTVNAGNEWVKWPLRRELQGITYAPGEEYPITKDNHYNEWQGWGVEPKRGDIKPWDDLLNIIFNKAQLQDDKKAKDFFESWCACLIQKPGVKMSSSVFICSRAQGIGKSTLGVILRNILGADNVKPVSWKMLEADNNFWAVRNVLAMIEEDDDYKTRRSTTNILKAAITQEVVTVDEKYVPLYILKNCTNFFITANDISTLRIEPEDRRHFIYESFSRSPGPEFFDALYDWLENHDGYAIVMHHLLKKDISKFNPKHDAPVTGSKLTAIDVSMTSIDEFVRYMIDAPDHYGLPDSDIFSTRQLEAVYNDKVAGNKLASTRGVHNAFIRNGAFSLGKDFRIRIAGQDHYLLCIRNQDKWRDTTKKKVQDYFFDKFEHFRIADKVSKLDTSKSGKKKDAKKRKF